MRNVHHSRLFDWIKSCCCIERYSPLDLSEPASGVTRIAQQKPHTFLHELAFCPHETSECVHQNRNALKLLSRVVQRGPVYAIPDKKYAFSKMFGFVKSSPKMYRKGVGGYALNSHLILSNYLKYFLKKLYYMLVYIYTMFYQNLSSPFN